MAVINDRADRPMVTLPSEPVAPIPQRPKPGGSGSLATHMERLYSHQPEPCRCDHAWRSLGRLDGIDMGQGWVRMNTHPRCLHHSRCHGFTDTVRSKGPRWWGRHLYCPVHKTKNCPKPTAYRIKVPDNGSREGS